MGVLLYSPDATHPYYFPLYVPLWDIDFHQPVSVRWIVISLEEMLQAVCNCNASTTKCDPKSEVRPTEKKCSSLFRS